MIRGGLRTRLVADSLRIALIGGLEARGWFDPTIYDIPPGSRRHHPVRYLPRPREWETPIAPNAIAISPEDVSDDPQGLGGELNDLQVVYVDVFGESDTVGYEIARDVRDLLLGKLITPINTGPVVDVYDLRQATPTPFTTVAVERVALDHAEGRARAWQAHWFMLRVTLEDEYNDENGVTAPVTAWAPSLAHTWAEVQLIEATA